MTTAELHEILDDENRKLTADELKEVVYQAKMFVRMTHTCPHNIPNLIPTIEEMKGGAE